MTYEEIKKQYEKVDMFLDSSIKIEESAVMLYRGDKRDKKEIEKGGGFRPKNNGDKPADYFNLIMHCKENSYGGPFISTTTSADMARAFADKNGKYVYQIKIGQRIVSEANWAEMENQKRILESCKEAFYKLSKDKQSTSEAMQLIGGINRIIEDISVAQEYHEKQQEVLVVNFISLDSISLDFISPN